MTKPEDLHGGWVLTRWDYTVDGEHRGYAMGEDADGQLLYTPDGQVSAILSRHGRPQLDALMWHQATEEERDEAALGYVSYGGTWELADEVVTHHLHYALFPNSIGTDFVRDVSWDGDQLVLTTAPETTTTGKSVVNRLFWQRASDQP